MKKFIAGFALAAILFTSIPIGAAIEEFILYRADYNIVANGKVYENPDLPALNYKGSTYIPLRKVADLLGVKLNWNASLNQAEIVKPQPSEQQPVVTPTPQFLPETTPKPPRTPSPKMSPWPESIDIRTGN